MNGFRFKTEEFEGPLDLLLDLIEKRKLLINDISLAQVTDEYVKHIETIPDTDIGSRAEFIVIASTLLLIKSRSLLPALPLSGEEKESIDDLEKRLKILQIIRDGSVAIKEHFGTQIIFPSQGSPLRKPVFSPHSSITLEAIKLALENIINRFPKKQELKQATVKKVISLEEVMESLSKRIQGSLSLSFKDFAGVGSAGLPKEKKVEVIVSFLAMLELVKQGIMDVMQHELFEDIKMETTDVGVPRY